MKTKFSFLIGLILSLTYIGCNKEQSNPSDIPDAITPFWSEIEKNKDSVPVGGSIFFSWSSNAELLVLEKNNGQKDTLPVNSSRNFVLQETTNFVFNFFKNDSNFVEDFYIKVFNPPPPQPGTLNISYNSPVPFGNTTTITISVIDGVVDNITVAPELPGFTGTTGNFVTPPLEEDITYVFKSYLDGNLIETVTVPITVLSPTDTTYVCSHPWMAAEVWKMYDSVNWVYKSPGESNYYSLVNVFNLDGSLDVYDLPEYNLVSSNAYWYFIDDTNIFWPYETKRIDTLSFEVFQVRWKSVVDPLVDSIMIKYVPYSP